MSAIRRMLERHRTSRALNQDQACMELCEECLESAKHPREQVPSVRVRPRVHHPKPCVPL